MRMITAALFLSLSTSCLQPDTVPGDSVAVAVDSTKTKMDSTGITKSDEEWRKSLTPEQYYILRQKGTERPYTGKYWNTKEAGLYKCAGCQAPLFTSDQKFDSHCGWPSFSLPWDSAAVEYTRDTSHGMIRTEVTCKKCGGHLGHVFDDGPPPTNLRYCINSDAMIFEKKD
jgi:peptide-methionine (R)-S-oxide reductase